MAKSNIASTEYNATEQQIIGIRKSLIEANDYLSQAGVLLQEQGETEFFHALVKANSKLVALDADLKERILNGSFK